MNLRYRAYDDQSLRVSALEFVDQLTRNRRLVDRVSHEEKKGLFIVKIQLSREYSYFRVEVIFRIFNQLTFPKNEDVQAQYISLYPQVRPLYLALRPLLHSAGLDDPGTSGINNFAFFLMVLAFVQRQESMNQLSKSMYLRSVEITPSSIQSQSREFCFDLLSPFNPPDRDGFNLKPPEQRPAPRPAPVANAEALGQTLLDLLYFYGFTFDFQNTCICPALPGDPIPESFFPVR